LQVLLLLLIRTGFDTAHDLNLVHFFDLGALRR